MGWNHLSILKLQWWSYVLQIPVSFHIVLPIFQQSTVIFIACQFHWASITTRAFEVNTMYQHQTAHNWHSGKGIWIEWLENESCAMGNCTDWCICFAPREISIITVIMRMHWITVNPTCNSNLCLKHRLSATAILCVIGHCQFITFYVITPKINLNLK